MGMKKTIGVFFGGQSVEHEISVISALEACTHISKELYEIIPVYIDKQGDWYSGQELLILSHYSQENAYKKLGKKVFFKQGQDPYLYEEGFFGKKYKIDIVFPILHGTKGEDGAFQGLITLKGLPLVGSSVLASALAMDKIITKLLLKNENIPVVDFFYCSKNDILSNTQKVIKDIESKFTYPLIVKPYNLGSSVGINKVNNKEELLESLILAVEYSLKVLVEPFLSNLEEYNCAVLGKQGNYKISLIEKPLSDNSFLSYQDKYLSKGVKRGMTSLKRELPANITEDLKKKIEEYTIAAASIFDLSGVARIDFLYSKNKLYLCEINTIPGTLAFYLWPQGFEQLLNEMIMIALDKDYEEKLLFKNHSINILKNFKDVSSSQKMGNKR